MGPACSESIAPPAETLWVCCLLADSLGRGQFYLRCLSKCFQTGGGSDPAVNHRVGDVWWMITSALSGTVWYMFIWAVKVNTLTCAAQEWHIIVVNHIESLFCCIYRRDVTLYIYCTCFDFWPRRVSRSNFQTRSREISLHYKAGMY